MEDHLQNLQRITAFDSEFGVSCSMESYLEDESAEARQVALHERIADMHQTTEFDQSNLVSC